MEKNGQPVELYRRYRPSMFKQIFGQPGAVKQLETLLQEEKFPHAVMFTGPSGVGKTTLARILKKKLDCGDHDFQEENCAQMRGIDFVRDIQQRMGLAPWNGSCRIWLFDEAHQFTLDAQAGLLKMLEDTPKHVYFFLCTTEPKKLLKTIRTRCTRIDLRPLPPNDLREVMAYVCKKEAIALPDKVRDRIIEVSDGSAREALKLLHQIIGVDSEEDQLEIIWRTNPQLQAVEVAKNLLNPQTDWKRMATILEQVDEELEGIRDGVLKFATEVLLGGRQQAADAFRIIQCFGNNSYSGGEVARKATLAASCYEVIQQRQTSSI